MLVSALELLLQNIHNECHQRLPGAIRVHQIHFAPGLRPDPSGGAYDIPPDLLVSWGGGYTSPFTTPLIPSKKVTKLQNTQISLYTSKQVKTPNIYRTYS